MNKIKKYITDLYFPGRFFLVAVICIFLFLLSFFFPKMYGYILLLFFLFCLLALADYILLFALLKSPRAKRKMSDRLSNGDANVVELVVKNRMRICLQMEILEELPEQFQERRFKMHCTINAGNTVRLQYQITPYERGIYHYGNTHLMIRSRMGLVIRRFTVPTAKQLAVYPSYLQMKKYQLLSKSTTLQLQGNKRTRKVGQSLEFEQIKEYVTGDDVRTLNWKATARRGMLMVNNYVDERSQQVYCIIDKGRLMKMPFNGLTLLDYAINSCIVIVDTCLGKQDKAGLITFADSMGDIVAADKKPVQRGKIMEVLYRQQTSFLEPDFEMLYLQVRNKIKQRSLLILYTNFESMNGLSRQLPYLRSLARQHLLMLVFFENTELVNLSHAVIQDLEDVYVQTVAEKFIFEKKRIVKELQNYGILTVLTSPENLTINTMNKYLEIKAKQLL